MLSVFTFYVKTGLKLMIKTVQTKLLTVSQKEQSVLAISEKSAKQNLEKKLISGGS